MTNKVAIRRDVLQCRRTINTVRYTELCRKIQASFLESSLYKKSRSLMLYLSVNREPDTAAIITRALDDGKIVLLPYMAGDKIYPALYTSDTPLRHGKYSIKEPAHPVFYPEKSIDVVVVPGVAFDHDGNRIGYGKGYYDRFLYGLRRHTAKVGFSFNACMVDEIYKQEWDVPVDVIFTETGKRTKEHSI